MCSGRDITMCDIDADFRSPVFSRDSSATSRIVDVNTGELLPLVPLVLKRNLLVQLIGAIPIAGGFINLVGILMIFRSSRRCLHDELAGTKVIKVKKS